jgi:hypothetical protein
LKKIELCHPKVEIILQSLLYHDGENLPPKLNSLNTEIPHAIVMGSWQLPAQARPFSATPVTVLLLFSEGMGSTVDTILHTEP